MCSSSSQYLFAIFRRVIEAKFRGKEEDEEEEVCSKHRAMNEVDAGRDRATPAWVRHDADQPLTLSLRATVRVTASS